MNLKAFPRITQPCFTVHIYLDSESDPLLGGITEKRASFKKYFLPFLKLSFKKYKVRR